MLTQSVLWRLGALLLLLHSSMAAVSLSVSTVKPLGDRVFVKVSESEEKTAGGILLPDTAKEKPMEGKVVSVGPGARDDNGRITPLDVKAGDTVLFGKWSGTEVKIDGEDLLIMKESDIMGVTG